MPLSEWDKDPPSVWVRPILENEAAVKLHFRNPEVRYAGSTSGCGCDFPHATAQNGGWPVAEAEQRNPEQTEGENHNRRQLVYLLRSQDEDVIEAYGVWAGDYEQPPLALEKVALDGILDSEFFFKEGGFYRVHT